MDKQAFVAKIAAIANDIYDSIESFQKEAGDIPIEQMKEKALLEIFQHNLDIYIEVL